MNYPRWVCKKNRKEKRSVPPIFQCPPVIAPKKEANKKKKKVGLKHMRRTGRRKPKRGVSKKKKHGLLEGKKSVMKTTPARRLFTGVLPSYWRPRPNRRGHKETAERKEKKQGKASVLPTGLSRTQEAGLVLGNKGIQKQPGTGSSLGSSRAVWGGHFSGREN